MNQFNPLPEHTTVPQRFSSIRAYLMAIGVTILIPSHVWADSSDDEGSEDAFLSEIPIVMSASRLPQSILDTPVSTTIITREEIEQSGFVELPDVFRLVPGFQVAHATGGHFVVAYHGQEATLSSRLEVMVDGRSVYGNMLSSVQWNSIGIALEDIERIEIVRGPNAPVFGANAVTATINIVTRQPYAEYGTWLNGVAGSQETANFLLRHAASTGDFDYRYSLGWKENSGFDVDETQGADFDSTRLGHFSFRGAWTPGADDAVDLQFGYTGGENATFNPVPQVLESNHDGALKSHFQFVRWTHTSDADSEFYLQLYHNYTDQRDRSELGPLSSVVGVPSAVFPLLSGKPDQSVDVYYADGTSQRYDFEFQRRTSESGNVRVVWGGGIRLDQLRSPAHLNRPDFVNNTSQRLFANIEWAFLPRLTLNAGSMLEHNEISDYFGSARISLSHRLNDTQSLHIGAALTQRSPSILEEYWDYLVRFNDGDPLNQIYLSPGNIDVETLRAYELGYTWLPAGTGIQLDLKLFHERAEDLVSSYRDLEYRDPFFQDGVNTLLNDDGYRMTGLEGALEWAFSRRDRVNLLFSLTKSHRVHARGGDNNPIQIEHEATPERTLSMLYTHRFDSGIDASVIYSGRSSLKWIGDGDWLDAYDRFDLRLGKHFFNKYQEGKLELVVQNLGKEYQEYISKESGRTTFKTRVYFKAGIKF